MLLDLKDIFVSDGASKDVSDTISLSDVEIAGEHPFTSPVELHAHVENKAGMVTLELCTSFEYHTSCSRCLVPIERRMEYHFSHKIIENLEEDFNDDYIEAPDLSLDLDELASSDILLELPTKFLCKGDCQGLCQKCGHNLNLGDCGCDKREIDPRLEALKALLE